MRVCVAWPKDCEATRAIASSKLLGGMCFIVPLFVQEINYGAQVGIRKILDGSCGRAGQGENTLSGYIDECIEHVVAAHRHRIPRRYSNFNVFKMYNLNVLLLNFTFFIK
jgi:hypothetical protein